MHVRPGPVLADRPPTLDAVEHAQRALTSFERLGAAIDADRAAAFLRSLGVAARGGPKRVGTLDRSASRRCCACSGSACRTPSSPNGCT